MKFLLFAALGFSLLHSVQAAPLSIFDGQTLTGWEGDQKLWHVHDGAIVGGSLSEKVAHNDFLATEKSYQNFELLLQFKLLGSEGFVNSGVQFRSIRIPNNPEMRGYQADLGNGWWGGLYDESRRNKVLMKALNPDGLEKALKREDWNEYRIRCEGAHLQAWINGLLCYDYTEADPTVAQDGHIGLQVHGGGKTEAWFRNIRIEELPPSAGAPTWPKP